MLPKKKMSHAEMRKWVWTNVFNTAVERYIQNREWAGIESKIAAEVADSAIEAWDKANKEV